jgi:hypothetical protein
MTIFRKNEAVKHERDKAEQCLADEASSTVGVTSRPVEDGSSTNLLTAIPATAKPVVTTFTVQPISDDASSTDTAFSPRLEELNLGKSRNRYEKNKLVCRQAQTEKPEVQQVIEALKLEPHIDGGYFR